MRNLHGPWSCGEQGDWSISYDALGSTAHMAIVDSKSDVVAFAVKHSTGYANFDILSNAQLIAAAPELLEELNNCFDLLDTCFPCAAVDSCIGVAITKARAAIAKATGVEA